MHRPLGHKDNRTMQGWMYFGTRCINLICFSGFEQIEYAWFSCPTICALRRASRIDKYQGGPSAVMKRVLLLPNKVSLGGAEVYMIFAARGLQVNFTHV